MTKLLLFTSKNDSAKLEIGLFRNNLTQLGAVGGVIGVALGHKGQGIEEVREGRERV